MAKKLYKAAGMGPDLARVRQVLDRPIKEWSKENTDEVFAFVERVTEGKTQKQLLAMEAKRLKASNPEAAEPKPEPPLGYNEMLKKARLGWEDLQQNLQTYGIQFTIMPEHMVRQQVEALELMLTARVMWLKYPTDLLTQETANDLFRRAVMQVEIDRLKKAGKK